MSWYGENFKATDLGGGRVLHEMGGEHDYYRDASSGLYLPVDYSVDVENLNKYVELSDPAQKSFSVDAKRGRVRIHRYVNAWDADFNFEFSKHGGFRKRFIFHTKALAPDTITLGFKLSGLYRSGAGIYDTDTQELVFRLPKPYWHDSANWDAGELIHSGDIPFAFVGDTFVITPDKASMAGAHGDIIVDPTLDPPATNDNHVMIFSYYPHRNSFVEYELVCAYRHTAGWHSSFTWDSWDLSGIPPGETITSALLDYYIYNINMNDPVIRDHDYSIMRTLRRWGSGSGYNTNAGTGALDCVDSRHNEQAWTTFMGDHDGNDHTSVNKATRNVKFDDPIDQWYQWDVTEIAKACFGVTVDGWTDVMNVRNVPDPDDWAAHQSGKRSQITWRSKSYTGDTTKRPKLTVVYGAAGAAGGYYYQRLHENRRGREA
jgi:hypothetical protein